MENKKQSKGKDMKQTIYSTAKKEIYRDGKGNAIKLFSKEYKKSDILNEAINQARVEEAGVQVATVNGVYQIDGKWAIDMKDIEGETLAELLKKNPKNTDKYLEEFVALQIEMQQHSAPKLTQLKVKMDAKIQEADIDDSIKYELQTRLHSMPKHNKLCHGDFRPSNIIYGKDGKKYIIDWSHATQGNASADVARTYLTFKLEKQDELAEKYLKLFSEKTKTPTQYIKDWLPIVAASQSVKGNADEREFLFSWLNVVDFN